MSEPTVPARPLTDEQVKQAKARRMRRLREVVLAVILLTSASLVVRGLSGWSMELAQIVGGLLLAGIAWLFLTEVS